MRRTRNNRTKTKIAAAAALFLAGLGVVSAVPASAVAVPLPISAVQQLGGHTTGVTFDNQTSQDIAAGQFGFPANVGDAVTVSFAGVTKVDGTPAVVDFVPGDAGYRATFCGNFTQGAPGGDHALTSADLSSLAGIVAHCSGFVDATSVATANDPVTGVPLEVTISATLTLTPPSAVAAVPAVPDSGVHGSPAVVAGSISPAIPATLDDPPADIPATLFTPFVAQGSIHAATPAIPAVPPADIPAIPDTFVAGTPAIAAVPGTQCVAANSALPCLIIVTTLDQSVMLALPAVNTASVAVIGRVGLYDPVTQAGVCNPTSVTAAPSTCPAARISTPTTPYPFIIGGGGFIPSANSPALISSLQGGADVPVAGDNVSVVTERLCPLISDIGCVDGVSDADPTHPVGVDASGNLGGSVVLSPSAGITPGDRFLQVTALHYVFTGDICPAAFTTLSAGLCSIAETHYAPLRILGDPTDPVFSQGSGAPGLVGSITGSGYEPRALVSIQRRDALGHDFSAPMTATVDGLGDLHFEFPAGALDFPVTSIVITVVDAAFGASTFTSSVVAFDAAAAVAFCLSSDTCNTGQIITAAALPGNVELLTGDAVVDIPPVDLSSIDIQDATTWYPLSEPGAMSQVLIGDMRGANTGFVVTGSVADLVGSSQPSNTIPAVDVFVAVDSIVCDVYANVGDGNDPLGVLSTGLTPDPQVDVPGASLLADGTQEFCTLLPDLAGRAAGMFQLDAALQIAGRPTTAVDDYTGLLVITITGN